MDAFLGEIRMFCGDYVPKDWLPCEGQLVRIAQFTALFSILGVRYGGDGKTIFALPDLRGRTPLSQGQGPGLSSRVVGEMGGSASVVLTQQTMPAHNHTAMGRSGRGTSNSPAGDVWAQFSSGGRPPIPVELYAQSANVQMAPDALLYSGMDVPHNNMQPYLPVRFMICTSGMFPARP